jgi:transposase-like protein
MALIDDALASLESLDPGELINYTQVAKKYGCDQNTLSRRHRGVQGTIANKIKSLQLLSNT